MKKMFAKIIIKKYQPTVIFVCGTWGKSMATSALYSMLNKSGVSVSVSSDNNNINAVIGGGGEKYSLLTALLYIVGIKKYPKILVIELHNAVSANADILSLIKQKIVLLSYITNTDIANAGGIKKYLKKNCLLASLNYKEFSVVFNADIVSLKEELEQNSFKQLISYAIDNSETNFCAQTIKLTLNNDIDQADDRIQGVSFKIKNGGSTLPLRIKKGIGKSNVYAMLANLAITKAMGINLVDSLATFRDYKVLPGRMALIPGIKKTLLVDDTYDIDAESAYLAFEEASVIPIKEGVKRIAVVGDMRIPGELSEKIHCELGMALFDMNYDIIVGIGERAYDILRCAKEAGMEESQLKHFINKIEAGKAIQHDLHPGDLVVIKGSKKDKFETIVKELMAFPLKAKEDLLQR